VSETGLPLTFASLRQQQEWDDPRLSDGMKAIVMDAANYAFVTWGWLLCLTSIFRTYEENVVAEAKTTIHCVWRAVDVRTRTAEQDWIDALTAYVNKGWAYDPERPSLPVAYSAPHGDGPHLHLQIHAHTVRRDA
jgi:hypothetical protein